MYSNYVISCVSWLVACPLPVDEKAWDRKRWASAFEVYMFSFCFDYGITNYYRGLVLWMNPWPLVTCYHRKMSLPNFCLILSYSRGWNYTVLFQFFISLWWFLWRGWLPLAYEHKLSWFFNQMFKLSTVPSNLYFLYHLQLFLQVLIVRFISLLAYSYAHFHLMYKKPNAFSKP